MSELTRANKITVVVDGDGFKADFHRTHKHVGRILSTDTEWKMEEGMTKTQAREDFRKYAISMADKVGIEWQPKDMRLDTNKRRATYSTDQDVLDDTKAMITGDIQNLMDKCPLKDHIANYEVSVEGVTPMVTSPKGKVLEELGIIEGKYANGNWAWADVEVTVRLETENGEDWISLNAQLVSGQLKKFKMTQTAWNIEVRKCLVEMEVIKEDADKESK